MLPSAICFVAYCSLFTLSLPTEWDQKRHNARHYSDKSSGHFPTAYAHSPTVKTQSQQAVTASGQWASSPLLLRSNAGARPFAGRCVQRVKVSQLTTTTEGDPQ